MNALFLAILLGSGPSPAVGPDADDLRCYRAMAELSRAEDPAARSVGLAAANYFLGRIDAAAPGYDTSSAPAVSAAERPALIRRCGEALNVNGFDLRALGASLDRPEPDA